MKPILFAAAALTALIAAAPAAAVTTVVDLTPTATGATAVIGHLNVEAGDFSDTFTFNWDYAGAASTSLINTALFGTDIDFSSITLNGVLGTVSNVGGISSVSFENLAIASGLQTLVVTGHSTGGASYGGMLQIENAVPEPATWALMLVGFGMIGLGARSRRRALARVSA